MPSCAHIALVRMCKMIIGPEIYAELITLLVYVVGEKLCRVNNN